MDNENEVVTHPLITDQRLIIGIKTVACGISLGNALVKDLIGSSIGRDGLTDETLTVMMATAINSNIA